MRFAVLALLVCLRLAAQPPDYETLGAQAFHFGYPLLGMAAWRDGAWKAGATPNQFAHHRELLSAFASEAYPDMDTLASTAWVDLTAGPVALRVPAAGSRYLTLQFIDAWTETFAVLSGTEWQGKAVMLYLTPPGWSGAPPAGYRQVSCPTSLVAVWLRLFVAGDGDVPAVRALQDQFAFSSAPPPRPVPRGVLEALGELLASNPPPPELRAVFARMTPLGLEFQTGFDPHVLDAATREAVDAAIDRASRDVPPLPPHEPRRAVNGWEIYDAGSAGPASHDERIRRVREGAAAFAALPATEFVYAVGYADANGNLLQGDRRYTIAFDAGAAPPVDAFWSLSVYTDRGRTVFGARNSVQSLAPSLSPGEDGTVRITLAPWLPLAEQSNWLPLEPGEGVRLILRLYRPRQAVFDGSWNPPPIEPVP